MWIASYDTRPQGAQKACKNLLEKRFEIQLEQAQLTGGTIVIMFLTPCIIASKATELDRFSPPRWDV